MGCTINLTIAIENGPLVVVFVIIIVRFHSCASPPEGIFKTHAED